MTRLITEFPPDLAAHLPATSDLLQVANLVVHEAVIQITLLGSRGLANSHKPTSDIDLSLMVDVATLPPDEPARGDLLREILNITLEAWQSPIDVDLAAVFDKGDCCGMQCFRERAWNEAVIRGRGADCFGIYKTQRGFDGYITEGVRLALMYPLLVIWRRDAL
jgi:hypothetical protein